MAALIKIIGVSLILLLLTACTVAEKPTVSTDIPAGFPEDFYVRAAAASGNRVYRIDSVKSLVEIRVYRSGVLARLGHDHIIASHNLQGYILLNAHTQACRADLFIPVNMLVVDEADLRKQAGLDTRPSAQDIESTRDNMLSKVLEATKFPFIVAQIRACHPAAHEFDLALALHGQQQIVPLPLDPAGIEDQAVRSSGVFSIEQSAFGITPFSALGGLLQVQNKVEVRYRIHASRMQDGGGSAPAALPSPRPGSTLTRKTLRSSINEAGYAKVAFLPAVRTGFHPQEYMAYSPR